MQGIAGSRADCRKRLVAILRADSVRMARGGGVSEIQLDLFDFNPGDIVEFIPVKQTPEYPGREFGRVDHIGRTGFVVFVDFGRGKLEGCGRDVLRLATEWEAIGLQFVGEL